MWEAKAWEAIHWSEEVRNGLLELVLEKSALRRFKLKKGRQGNAPPPLLYVFRLI